MEDTLAGHCKYHHGNPHHAGHHQLHGSVMQKKCTTGSVPLCTLCFFIGLSQLGALGVEHLAVLHDIEFAVVKHLAGGGALGRSNRIIDTRWCGYVLDQPTINILLLKSASSTARADANNDKFFIVIIDLMVIWDYSHQKMHKVTYANAKRTPKIPRNSPSRIQL